MKVYSHQGPETGGLLILHSIDAPGNYTGYIVHMRHGSNVLYHALSREDLATLRDAIDTELKGAEIERAYEAIDRPEWEDG